MAIIMALAPEGIVGVSFISLLRSAGFKFSLLRVDIVRSMEHALHNEAVDAAEKPAGRRVERAAFETDRQLVEGDLTLPPAGYQSRFSDSLNRGEFEFLPLTNAKVTSLEDGKVSELPFVVLSKRHIRVAYPTGR
jgi:hypothetical protein